MPLLQFADKPHLTLRLSKDLLRSIKRGNPWVFSGALRNLPAAAPGTWATLVENKGKPEIAHGFYDPGCPLAFRVCAIAPGERLNEAWALRRFNRALQLRRLLFDERTTGFRLFNGEGDGLPGLICDIYGDAAVIQLDGAGPGGFWHAEGVAEWIVNMLSAKCVCIRVRGEPPRFLIGEPAQTGVTFRENSHCFAVDIVRGQKTGFFLDQRDNRHCVGEMSVDKRVLNLFGYTGGFSIYAGARGANLVTTVDISQPALKAAQLNWRLNDLPVAGHQVVEADAFHYLDGAIENKQCWDVVVVDPPSFASSKAKLPAALQAYKKLFTAAAKVTCAGGMLAVSSCSSHVTMNAFIELCESAVSQARRRATVVAVRSQPADHPSPLALPEFRYLKFVMMRID